MFIVYPKNEIILKKFYWIFIFIVISHIISYGQDIHFTQLSQTQFASNPAFTGIQYGPRILLHYRSQYPQIGAEVNGGYNTLYASYDQFINDYNSGIGLQAYGDKYGDNIFSKYFVQLNYAYQARLNDENAFRIGLSGNLIFQQLDRTKLRFYDQIDPIYGFDNYIPTQEVVDDNYTQSYFNFNAGAVYFRNNFYLGLSARNLLPKKNFYNSTQSAFADMALSAQAGAVFWLNTDNQTAIFPYLLYERQYGYQKWVVNVIGQYRMMNIGLGFRYGSNNLESIMPMFGVNFKRIRLSYSYDIHAGGLDSYSGGAHEIGLRFLLRGEDNSLRPNEYKNILFCPDFLKN